MLLANTGTVGCAAAGATEEEPGMKLKERLRRGGTTALAKNHAEKQPRNGERAAMNCAAAVQCVRE